MSDTVDLLPALTAETIPTLPTGDPTVPAGTVIPVLSVDDTSGGKKIRTDAGGSYQYV